MASSSERRRREADRQRRLAAADQRRARTERRRRVIAAAVGILVILAVVGGFVGARASTTSTSSSTTTTRAPSTTTTALPTDGVQPIPAAPGATLTGATPCPAEDGSTARTTMFASAPPTCIETDHFYTATITTSRGTFTVQLNPKVSPQTVNTFVVLARYHYYDGQPLTKVSSRAQFAFGMAFTGGGTAPGFDIPGEIPAKGTVFSPGSLSMAPASSSNGIGGRLVVSTFDQAPSNDQNVTPLGVMMSGDSTIAAIDALASQTGLPTATASITSITIVRSGAIS